MLKLLIVFVVAFAAECAKIAGAAEPPKKEEEEPLTIAQALDVTAGLGQLSSYESVDKEGKPSKGYYKFSADLRILVALNIDLGRRLQTSFQNATNDLVMQMSAGAGKVPDDKVGLFNIELSKMMAQPSRVGFHRLKLEDLCLEAKPPKCEVGNQVPGPTLSLIVPILDVERR